MAKGDWKIWLLLVVGVVAIGFVAYGIWYGVRELDDHGLMNRALNDAQSK